MGWDFKRVETQYEQIPVGKHRIRVKSVEAKKSKSGNDMLEIQFDVSGINSTLYHYITFLDDKPEITNRMLTQFFDSFKDIPEGNFKFKDWTGKMGACVVAVDKNDDSKTRLSYFIKADKQGDLPQWQEPKQTGSPAAATVTAPAPQIEDDDLPF